MGADRARARRCAARRRDGNQPIRARPAHHRHRRRRADRDAPQEGLHEQAVRPVHRGALRRADRHGRAGQRRHQHDARPAGAGREAPAQARRGRRRAGRLDHGAGSDLEWTAGRRRTPAPRDAQPIGQCRLQRPRHLRRSVGAQRRGAGPHLPAGSEQPGRPVQRLRGRHGAHADAGVLDRARLRAHEAPAPALGAGAREVEKARVLPRRHHPGRRVDAKGMADRQDRRGACLRAGRGQRTGAEAERGRHLRERGRPGHHVRRLRLRERSK
jgi:hypothetical protein